MPPVILVALGVGYLLGAVPSGVIVGRLRGVDPRASGSGRTGTTNALRTLGLRWALLVLVMDVAKGAGAVLAGGALAGDWGAALAGVAAVAGHVWSVFIGFRGGRGVATGAGALAVLAPLALAAAVPVFLAAVAATRYVSLGSILAAVTAALATLVLLVAGWEPAPVLAFGAAVAVLVVLAHTDNIARLRAGTERRLGATEAAPSDG